MQENPGKDNLLLMKHVFLSPHMDDAVLSAGDLIIKLQNEGKKVLVVTVFTEFGRRPLSFDSRKYLYFSGFLSLSKFSRQRKREDNMAMKELGIDYIRLGFIDGGFRMRNRVDFLNGILANVGFGSKFIYPYHTKRSLYSGKISRHDKALPNKIKYKLKEAVNKSDILYAPLGVGNSADHLIVKQIASTFGNKKYFWVDAPYIMEKEGFEHLKKLEKKYRKAFTVDRNSLKSEAIKSYKSQLRFIYDSETKLVKEAYYEKNA